MDGWISNSSLRLYSETKSIFNLVRAAEGEIHTVLLTTTIVISMFHVARESLSVISGQCSPFGVLIESIAFNYEPNFKPDHDQSFSFVPLRWL